ncbi:EF-hand [Lanmaoa asiatica]|nr:EF-hand [Lanmaoa asiatica]
MSYAGYGPPPSTIYAPPSVSSYTSSVAAPLSSGYPAGPLVAPPDADPQLWNWFNGVNVDRSGEITIVELRKFSSPSIVVAIDHDRGFAFAIMTIVRTRSVSSHIPPFQDWQNLFRHFDRDHSGTIDNRELRDALSQFGYRLTPRLIELIERKYASPVTYSGGGITFDRFVRACVVVKQITESFRRHDSNGDGWIQIDYDGFMEIVLSLP